MKNSQDNLGYLYDAFGNVRQITNNGETNTYEYDGLDRLTSWTLGGQSETYWYDANGYLDLKAGLDLQYNSTTHANAVTNVGNNTYAYDLNGNQTERVLNGQTYTLAYDAENRLVSVNTTPPATTPTAPPTSTATGTPTSTRPILPCRPPPRPARKPPPPR